MGKILIVDDDPDLVEACQLYLEKEGHEVASACNVGDGKQEIEVGNFDLVILDVMMEQPDDGIALAQELRKSGFETPILMLSAISRVTSLDYDMDDGIVPVDAFLEKPVEPGMLIAKVAELLSK